jgi:hypothetical protein
LLVRIQPEEPISQQQLTDTERWTQNARAVFLPVELQETGAILHVLPPKNPVKNRTVNRSIPARMLTVA